MLTDNQTFWRRVSWPTLFLSAFYFIFSPIPSFAASRPGPTTAPVDSVHRGQLLKVFHEDTDKFATNGAVGYYEEYGYDADGRQDRARAVPALVLTAVAPGADIPAASPGAGLPFPKTRSVS